MRTSDLLRRIIEEAGYRRADPELVERMSRHLELLNAHPELDAFVDGDPSILKPKDDEAFRLFLDESESSGH